MFTVLILMSLTRSYDITLFFILMLIGLLVLVELTSPYHISPKWIRRLSWVVAAGVVVFMAIVVKKAMDILGT
ncbi:hypothetical protein [Methermicoccus shengliensis]|nr:hypothetical protein [Methermicoccus shengliensis]